MIKNYMVAFGMVYCMMVSLQGSVIVTTVGAEKYQQDEVQGDESVIRYEYTFDFVKGEYTKAVVS